MPIQFPFGRRFCTVECQGEMYWDFYGGHAVTLIGNSHPKWASAISKQAHLLGFCTTISPISVRAKAAQRVCQFTGMDMAWFVNSGAEANEGAIKMARKYTGKTKMIAMEKGISRKNHGRLGGHLEV